MTSALGAALPALDLDDPRLVKLIADIVDARVEAAIKRRVPEVRVGMVDSLLADGDVIVRAHGLGSDGTPMPFLGSTPTVGDRVRAYKWPVGKGTPMFFAEPLATFDTTSDLPVLYVKNFGAVGDGETDDSDAWQNAINSAIDLGGGTIYAIPGATHVVSSRLLINGSGVQIDLQGAKLWRPPGGSALEVVIFATDQDALPLVRRCSLVNGTIDGSGVANYSVHIKSCDQIRLDNLYVIGGTVWQLRMDCWDNGSAPAGSDPRGTQMCDISNLFLKATGSAGGLLVGGNGTVPYDADTSLNWFQNIHVTITDGDAFSWSTSDGNVASQLRVYRTPAGTGRGLVLAGASAVNGNCRHNLFYGVQVSDGGCFALAGTVPSTKNFIFGYSLGNGSPLPVISAGADLGWVASDGSASYNGAQVIVGGRLTLATSLAASLAASVNDWAPAGWGTNVSRLITTATAAWNITGLDATGAVAGDVVILASGTASAGVITLKHNNAGSIAGNRLFGRAAADVTISAGGAVMLVYMGSRWQIIGA